MAELSTMPKYKEYKNSGIDWLGDIPENWDISKIKNYSNIYNGDSLNEKQKAKYESEDENHLAYISSKDINVHNAQVNYLNGLRIPRGGSYKVSPTRSTLMCIEGGSAGKKIAFTNQDVCFVNKLACFVAKKGIDNKFLFYYLSSKAYKDQFFNAMTGLIGGVAISSIKNFRLVLPPVTVQVAIARFLDTKTAQIDEAIAIKVKQIELLKERKQIIIQKAVTQGLNLNAPMKDSGVYWIGEIPEHWEVRRSKFLFTQRKERAWKTDVQLSATQAYGVIPQSEYEALSGSTVVKIQFHLDKRKHVEKDDFVISMRSFQGGLERAWSSGCIRSSYVVLRPLEEINPDFYGYLLKLPSYIKALQRTGNFIRDGQDLNFDNFSQVDLFIPPLEEQKAIAEYVKEFMVSSDKGIELLQKQIEKLKEYKTTLINSAVTGKIKVPEVDLELS